uniref:Uncharacterized protein n=1 Tax=Plectus sambesii TaxID=2011161 RepID=A0A914WN96_9BILA
MANHILISFTFATLLTLGSTLTCYYCSGNNCESNTCNTVTALDNGVPSINTNQAANVCLKVSWTKGEESIYDKHCAYDSTVGGDPSRIVEGCNVVTGSGDGTVTGGPIMTVCKCKTDYCNDHNNGAKQNGASVIIVAL